MPSARPENAVFSGDLVKRDDEGFLYFVGRKDEMIKTSGYRVSPTEIEQVAYAPGSSATQSRSASTTSASDSTSCSSRAQRTGGSTPTSCSRSCAASCRSTWCRSAVVIRPSLPRSPNNKLDRNLLREELTG